jgi:hypothetical protein
MKLLLDECVTRDLKRDLVGHDSGSCVFPEKAIHEFTRNSTNMNFSTRTITNKKRVTIKALVLLRVRNGIRANQNLFFPKILK